MLPGHVALLGRYRVVSRTSTTLVWPPHYGGRGGDPDFVTRHLDYLRQLDDSPLNLSETTLPRLNGCDSQTLCEGAEWYDAVEFYQVLSVDTTFILPKQMLRKVAARQCSTRSKSGHRSSIPISSSTPCRLPFV